MTAVRAQRPLLRATATADPSAAAAATAPRLSDSATPASALALVVRFCAGIDDPAALELLRSALGRWRREGGNLLAHLHVPQTPRGFRLAERDYWLRDCALTFERAASTWERAKQLRDAALRFSERTWPRWHKRREPRWEEMPSAADVALFYARSAAGEPFPSTVEQYVNILDS